MPFRKPLTRFVNSISLVTCFGILVSLNIVGNLFFPLIALILLAALVVMGWGIALLVSIYTNRRLPRQRAWLTVPAIFGVAFVLTIATADRDLVLRVSSPWIERDVRAIMANTSTPSKKGWLGPLPVTAIVRTGDTLYFQVAGAGFINSAGYAWSESVPRTDDRHPFLREVKPNWWKWEDESFLEGM